ncbi:MAG: FAD-dependent oxidoreductase [Candidatus Schekmanbacteria bacterium]|nr:MAG: FAD-dependent oxidoreductase [Candidatus Schekmanbacteria bacterium]
MSERKKVIILGGGPAGLSAAWKIAQANHTVIVVEKENQVGGLCMTVQYGDYHFDLGGHRFITQNVELANEIYSLMTDEIITRNRKSVIRLQGEYFSYPLEAKDLLKKLKLSVSIKCFVDYLYSILRCKLFNVKDISFEDWVVNRFGRSLYEIYFGPYSQKLWGVMPNQISSDWAAQRISLINLWDVFLRLLGKKSNTPKTYATRFFYPEKGIGRIPEKMAEVVEEKQGTIYLGYSVEKIICKNNQIDEIIAKKDGETLSLKGDYFISTIPLPEFIQKIEPSAPEEILKISKEMKFRSLVFLNILLDKEMVSDNTWMYIPELCYLFMRIQEPKNWSPHSAPPGKTSLILEIACNAGDEIWRADKKTLYDRCVDDLDKIGFSDIKEKTIDYFLTYAEHAYPIYRLNYKEQLKKTIPFINSFENLVCCGRQGLFRYNNMDHSIEMGLLAAEHVLFGLPKNEILKIASEEEIFEHDAKQAKIEGIE